MVGTRCAARPTYRFRHGIAPRGVLTSPICKTTGNQKLLASTMRAAHQQVSGPQSISGGRESFPARCFGGTGVVPREITVLGDYESLQLGGELRWHARLDEGPVRAVLGPRHLAGGVRPGDEVAPAVGDAGPDDAVPLWQPLLDRRAQLGNPLAGLRGDEHRAPLA